MAIGKNVINIVTSTLLQMLYPNQSINKGAIAVVGMVCEATITGYSARSIFGFASMAMASPTPNTTEIKSPIAVTDMVAGRCTKNKGSLNSQSLTQICVGEGSI